MKNAQMAWRYGFALAVIIAGLVLEHFGPGNEFLGFASAGIWLIYVGFVMVAVVTLQAVSKKEKLVDERMQKVGYVASRVTFLFIILASFVTMMVDGVNRITVPYHLFLAYAICAIVLVYLVAFKFFERRVV